MPDLVSSIGAEEVLDVRRRAVHLRAEEGPSPNPIGRICMLAYTNYRFDARVRREAETLAAHGYDVLCLTTRNSAERACFELNGVRIRELGVPKYRGKSTIAYLASYLHFLLASTWACLRLLVAREVDVVHVHNIPDLLVLSALVPRMFKCGVILDVHDSMPETYATKFSSGSLVHTLLCLEERLSATVAHRVICVNHPQRDALVGRGIPAYKTLVSMNVPDPGIFDREPRCGRAGPSSGPFKLVYHGTMVHRLGVDLLIRAAARLRERIPDLELHLWGQGDDLTSFQTLARTLGASDWIEFNPAGVALHDLPVALQPMHLGVIGNRRSVSTDLMLPVKLMEYVSLGIPVVAPRLKTIQYYFSESMVAYYEPEDVTSLVEVISRVHADPEARSRQAELARRILDEYGWRRQSREFVRMYRTLCGGDERTS